MSVVRNKPGILKKDATFKKLGQDKTVNCRAGKAVSVDRHALDQGKFVIFAYKGVYLVVGGEELHEYVEWK